MALRKKQTGLRSSIKNVNDMQVALMPDQVGQGWDFIIPENVQLTEDRPYKYREVKAYALLAPETKKQAQLLIVLFDYGDDETAQQAFKDIGKGLESEMPKRPGVGDDSILWELDMKPMVRMKIAAMRKGSWLVIMTAWLFQDYEVEDQWVKTLLERQLARIVF
ncbi:MAG: hypothetical protein A4E32_01471 [Methanomassiliicoccales archaeon PtaU1.Bin124]|nr:MAG: hypothetical protein A4E32_01471 [Methanomassiliicoccales archaeon PtaU1.Bin124]